MISFILLLVGNVIFTSGLYLNCTNDFESLMSCHSDAQSCTDHNMKLHNIQATVTCVFAPCVRGCCCSMPMTLVYAETFTADVFRGGQRVHSQTIGITETIKPKTPQIISVVETNGIYQTKWKTTEYKIGVREMISAIVTYKKNGDNKKISEIVKPNTMEDMNSHEILGRNLESSTTYVVNVKTFTDYGIFSDSSNEVEFKTASSPNGVLTAVIFCLSVIAVIVSVVAFASFIKVKGKLWDKAAKEEKPKILDIQHKRADMNYMFLRPESLSVYSLSVEPLVPKHGLTLWSEESLADSGGRSGQTSGISSCSSPDSYANTEPVDAEACVLEALDKLMPLASPVQTLGLIGLLDSKSSTMASLAVSTVTPVEFVNKTYTSTNISNLDNAEIQTTSDSEYHLSKGPSLQDLISLPAILETDMSYQPCTKSEGENLLLTSSGASSGLDSDSFLPVVYGYQAFETLVEQPGSAFSEHKSEGEELKMKLGLINSMNNVCLSHMSSVTADPREINVDYGYHCV